MLVPGIFALIFGPARIVIFPERGLQSTCPKTPTQPSTAPPTSTLTLSQLASSARSNGTPYALSAPNFHDSFTPFTNGGQGSECGAVGPSLDAVGSGTAWPHCSSLAQADQ